MFSGRYEIIIDKAISLQQSLQKSKWEDLALEIAVRGRGRIGSAHAKNIASHLRAKLAGVFDDHHAAGHELGSNHGVTVFDFADALFFSGDVEAVQIATSASTHADFIEKAVAAGKPSDGRDPSAQIGALINSGRLSKIGSIVSHAVKAGAQVATGGERDFERNAGHFYKPTALSNGTDDIKAFAADNFGPIAAITRLNEEDEVLVRANASDGGADPRLVANADR
jgi:hypothetical protein